MVRCTVLAILASIAAAPFAAAADPLVVSGSSHKYPRTLTTKYGDQTLTLRLTGAGMRTRLLFNVYTVGCYVQDNCPARTAEEVAGAETARMLYLVMERTVSSGDFIDAFKSAVGKSYPADRFAVEFNQLAAAVGSRSAEKGDQICLFYIPEAGLRIQIIGKVDVTIKNAAFARALWEVYLGPKPIDEDLKKSMVSLLGR